MSSVEIIRDRVVQSQLLSPDDVETRLAEWRTKATPDADSDAFLHWLVQKNLLTEFQSEALTAGMTGPFMLGPYKVQEHLAGGRLGHLFRAVHVEFNQPVSLKVFPESMQDDPEKLARMQREARISIQVDNPHVMRTFQIGRAGKVYFLAFEDLSGESLESRLARDGRLEYPEACRLIRQAALGMESLHESDITHRDLRPGNLWINQAGQLKIMEFGAARDSLSFLDTQENNERSGLTKSSGLVLGNYSCIAPEQARSSREADARSDIYSLGCCLYYALAGRPPFMATNTGDLLVAHATETPQLVNWLVPQVPQPLAEVVGRMLAKEPDARFQTAGEVDWALQPFVEDGQVNATTKAGDDWNPDYLDWVRSLNMAETLSATGAGGGGSSEPPVEQAGVSSEFNEFLDWISEKRSKPENENTAAE